MVVGSTLDISQGGRGVSYFQGYPVPHEYPRGLGSAGGSRLGGSLVVRNRDLFLTKLSLLLHRKLRAQAWQYGST